MIVPDKQTNYEMVDAGAFGNRLRHWRTVREMEASGHTGLVTIRYRQPASPFCLYDVPAAKVQDRTTFLIELGARPELLYYNEAAPDHELLLQGEVMRSARYLTLFSSTAPTRMRDALRTATQTEGLTALHLLQEHLAPASMDDLEDLLDRYEDHIIEFSTYRVNLGQCPGRNTVFWEVRSY